MIMNIFYDEIRVHGSSWLYEKCFGYLSYPFYEIIKKNWVQIALPPLSQI